MKIHTFDQYKDQLGDSGFKLWLSVIEQQDLDAPRNIEAECADLRSEPSNEGIKESEVDSLIINAAARYERLLRK